MILPSFDERAREPNPRPGSLALIAEAIMCELLAMSARFPTTIHLSLDELARHGGGTGPHRDGWGLGFVQGHDALVVREPDAASASPWISFLQEKNPKSDLVIAHIRRATQGSRALCNTQPFARELGGRTHLFAHNGMLPGIEDDRRFSTRRFRRIGETDSEQAFVALMERLARRWEDGVPSLDERLAEIAPFAADLRALGPANFLYTDGDAIFAHAHRRRAGDGDIKPPGLHLLCRTCEASADGASLQGVTISHDARQEVALLASVPLSEEHWTPLAEGEIVVLQGGRVIERRTPGEP
jgi:predicted glutamine amidotransferase